MRSNGTRRDLILESLSQGEGDVDRLALRFGVSASTIRRDLQHLSERRAIARTYGGAILAPVVEEASLPMREGLHRDAKAAIAEAALALLRDGETLILDGGSTVEAFGRRLRGRRHRIITNNLTLIPLLADAPGIELVVLGGAVRPISMGTTGPLAEAALRRLTADRCFTSADGVIAGRGLCEATLEQVALKTLMMEQAADTVVLADASKLGHAGQPCWAPLLPGCTLITNAGAEQTAPFARLGTRIIQVR